MKKLILLSLICLSACGGPRFRYKDRVILKTNFFGCVSCEVLAEGSVQITSTRYFINCPSIYYNDWVDSTDIMLAGPIECAK